MLLSGQQNTLSITASLPDGSGPQTAAAALGCQQKVVVTLAVAGSTSLATSKLQFSVPCVGRCGHVHSNLLSATETRWETDIVLATQLPPGLLCDPPRLFSHPAHDAHGNAFLAAAPMASAPAPATTPPIRRAPAATLPRRSTSLSPSRQCMRPTRCSTRAPSMPSPTRCAPAEEHLCRAEEEQGRFPSHPVESALGTPGCATPLLCSRALPPSPVRASPALKRPIHRFRCKSPAADALGSLTAARAQHHMNWTAASDGRARASLEFEPV